ncbi:hypothetical protein [Pedobacter psychrodurus]|jgi:hypothetical protein|uniref:hypothetical protein n=1 Tax=Pedobacter psychrodurus TaxID=2530456 RepID=UPI00292DB868|nr:hypothetical protein [Pedobacter psychrodurus]
MIENLKQIKAKDLKVGNYLANLGVVQEIEIKNDNHAVVLRINNEKHIFNFLPGRDLIIIENVIVDEPMEHLLSPGIRSSLKNLFETKRVEVKKPEKIKDQREEE